jgi:hypothetical protein
VNFSAFAQNGQRVLGKGIFLTQISFLEKTIAYKMENINKRIAKILSQLCAIMKGYLRFFFTFIF